MQAGGKLDAMYKCQLGEICRDQRGSESKQTLQLAQTIRVQQQTSQWKSKERAPTCVTCQHQAGPSIKQIRFNMYLYGSLMWVGVSCLKKQVTFKIRKNADVPQQHDIAPLTDCS